MEFELTMPITVAIKNTDLEEIETVMLDCIYDLIDEKLPSNYHFADFPYSTRYKLIDSIKKELIKKWAEN